MIVNIVGYNWHSFDKNILTYGQYPPNLKTVKGHPLTRAVQTMNQELLHAPRRYLGDR